MSAAPRRAFTLVELMVVVTIIVILIALLTPTLDKAMGAANKATCLANLKAFSTAYRLYSTDCQGDVALIYTWDLPDGTRQYWNHRLAPYMGFTTYGKGGTVDGAPKFMVCPETVVKYQPNTAYAPNAHETWDWKAGQSSYAMNLWLTDYSEYTNGATWYYLPEYLHVKFDRAAGQTPVVGDGFWIGSWPVPSDLDRGSSRSYEDVYGDGGMGVFGINRHGNFTTNLGFVDGSARNMVLGELWNVPWHRKFNPSYKSGGWD